MKKKVKVQSPINYGRAAEALEQAKKLTTKQRKNLKSGTFC